MAKGQAGTDRVIEPFFRVDQSARPDGMMSLDRLFSGFARGHRRCGRT